MTFTKGVHEKPEPLNWSKWFILRRSGMVRAKNSLPGEAIYYSSLFLVFFNNLVSPAKYLLNVEGSQN